MLALLVPAPTSRGFEQRDAQVVARQLACDRGADDAAADDGDVVVVAGVR